jgi:hypothetical protein
MDARGVVPKGLNDGGARLELAEVLAWNTGKRAFRDWSR